MSFNGYLSINSKDKVNNSITDARYPSLNVDFRNTRAIAVDSYSFTLNSPNVNARNQEFAVSDGATSYPVTVEEDFYTLPALITAIQDALNLSPIGPFTVTESGGEVVIQNVSTPFYFVKVNEFNAIDLLGVTYNNILSNEQLGYPGNLQYTDYVDLVSDSLHSWQTIADGTTNNKTGSILQRVYLPPFAPSVTVTGTNQNLKWIDVTNATSTSPINIRLIDCFGEELYVDPNLDVTKYSMLLLTR